jgi:hypothetical protein
VRNYYAVDFTRFSLLNETMQEFFQCSRVTGIPRSCFCRLPH